MDDRKVHQRKGNIQNYLVCLPIQPRVKTNFLLPTNEFHKRHLKDNTLSEGICFATWLSDIGVICARPAFTADQGHMTSASDGFVILKYPTIHRWWWPLHSASCCLHRGCYTGRIILSFLLNRSAQQINSSLCFGFPKFVAHWKSVQVVHQTV